MPDPEILRDGHPLDHTPAPDYIPPQWDGPHVGKRLAEALRTLRYMPLNGYPTGFRHMGSPVRIGDVPAAGTGSPIQ
jgi:hypothetical protein